MLSDRVRANRKLEITATHLRNERASMYRENAHHATFFGAGAGILLGNTNTPGQARSGASRQSPPWIRGPCPPVHWEFPQENATAGKRATAAHCRRCADRRRASA